MPNLFAIRKLGYVRVNHPSLPCRPEGNPQFVYIGRGFRGKPDNIDKYIMGGWAYSEKRKREIHSKMAAKSFFRGIFGCITGNSKPVFILNE